MALKLNERYPGRFNNPSTDYPQGSFKNRTTPISKDGSYLEKDWANDKEGFFQSLLADACFAANGLVDAVGASQYLDAMLAIISKNSVGVVGLSRNLKMSVVAASATASLTADEIVVSTALGGLRYCLSNFNKTINLATTGAGGMDAGAAPASGFVSIYAIYNPTSGASALLACNQTTSSSSVYTGANMPSGYTASCLVSAWLTTAAGLLAVGSQQDLTVDIALTTVINAAANTSPIGISISTIIPSAAKSVSGVLQVSSNTGTLSSVQVASTIALIGQRACGVRNPGLTQASFSDVQIITASQLFFSCLTNGTDISAFVGISSYKI